ncbi:MAG: CopG family transcriptional regulator [Rhodanobacteraceae bacterium]|nr:MAG: CopG family transcriptional regulator [Rhodanobacteraceae bacterium]
MKAKAFDRKFESGADIIADLDLARASRPQLVQKRVNVDFPNWMVDRLDKEAKRLGVTRQSVIKVWLSERLEQTASQQG